MRRSATHSRPATTNSRALTLSAITALATGGLALGTGTAEAEERLPGSRYASCLWAGTAHDRGASVHAGGWTFRCGTDNRGAASWSRTARTTLPSTVANPGAHTDPTDSFSPGARQPGTSYTDHCVGNQLIEGTDDVFQAVAHHDGRVYWKAVSPITDWTFHPVETRPEPTWRSSGNCSDGSLI
ncbi:hypothetical protein [Nocardia jiangxiensis]|uniref:Secreted protein n=1 Tax=Nocardia jiangxiensis TaxID=282685 RepID=A0ABW6S634_9NOCA|nr:hypothetical protein [Nocardia jiangxiensis]